MSMIHLFLRLSILTLLHAHTQTHTHTHTHTHTTTTTTPPSSDVILKPIKQHPIEKLIVFIEGGLVPNSDYSSIAVAIQQASPYQLWFAIPNFAGNFPVPTEISSIVKTMISDVQQAGFTNLNTSTDVYIAGHSVGGTFAQSIVIPDGYAGLILFGSYLLANSATPNPLYSFPVPVLTLAAELDGCARITRLAKEYTNYLDVVRLTSLQTAVVSKPVVLIPGISHSQFCSGVNITCDIFPAEIDIETAHSQIAQITAAFLENINNATETSYGVMSRWIDGNAALVDGWYQAQAAEKDTQWCAHKQAQISMLKPAVSMSVKNNVTNSMLELELSHPTIQKDATGVVDIVTESYLSYEFNPIDLASTIISAQQVYCKLKSDEAIADTVNMTIPTQITSCQQLNQATIEQALSLVSPAAKARYYRRGAQLSVIADNVQTTGIGWLLASVAFSASSSSPLEWTVQSPTLISPQSTPFGLGGMHYCTLLSPARVVEWILVDSMKASPAL